jgi:tetratricopeptide (TPR) repeat protein
MAKRKKHRTSTQRDAPALADQILAAINQANELVTDGRYEEAVQLLEPLAARYHRQMELQGLLGSAYAGAGKLWEGVVQYENALALKRDADMLVSLGFLYSRLDFQVLALGAFRQAIKSGAREPLRSELLEYALGLEDYILEVSREMHLSPEKTIKGLRLMEEGQIALHREAYPRSI